MTTVGDINSATLSNNTSSSSSNTGLGTLTSADFMKLMITQLSNQDPLNPTDSNQMLGQISQISTLQSNTQMTQSLSSLTLQQSIGAGGNLVGKTVTGVDSDGNNVTGVVNGIKVINNQVYLAVTDSNGNTNPVAMNNLTQVSNATSDAAVFQQGLLSLSAQQSLANSNGMIGKYVTATDSSNNTLSGTVTGVQLKNQAIYLNLDNGTSIPAANVTGFSSSPPATAAAASNDIVSNAISALSDTLAKVA
jgi:flagellar basal-body rod modification protein FlgD